MKIMKSRIRLIFQRRGLWINVASTLSVGIVTWARSYRKLLSKICVGSIGRNRKNNEAPAMLNILPKFELVPISRYFITITEPISLYPGDSVEYDGDFHLILKNNNQGLTAIQELLTTLVQETREYKARVMLDKDFRVIVEEAVSAAIKTTPLVQLT